MKKYILIAIFLLFIPGSFQAEEFLSVPVLPGSQTVSAESNRLEFKTRLSHDDVLAFYREELKGMEDIKYREWKDATYIEDDGSRPWHSITISKTDDQKETTVIIAKDSWTWIMGTLILRFIGVFIVLLVLFAGMKIYGSLIKRIAKKEATERS